LLGQRAGLVRADDGDRTEGLDRRQSPDDGVLARHDARADGQHDGDDRRQTLGDRRHRQADDGEEDLQHGHVVYQIAVQESEQSDHQDETGDLAGELVEPARERRRQGARSPDDQPDASDLGRLSGADDKALRLAKTDHCSGKRHAQAVTDRCVVRHRLRALLHGYRFAGQAASLIRRFFTRSRRRSAGTRVAGFEKDDIPGNQQRGIDFVPLAVAQDGSATGQHRAHRFQRLFGLAFLNETDNRVDQHHADDYSGIDIVARARK
jgi:hypothetical protein